MQRRNGFWVCLFTLSVGSLLLMGQERTAGRVDSQSIENLLEKSPKPKFVPGEMIVEMKTVAGVISTMPAAAMRKLNMERMERGISGGRAVYRITSSAMATLSAAGRSERTPVAGLETSK